jgi:hypothetical protein
MGAFWRRWELPVAALMMDVDFYRLERPVQDRFSDATRAIGVPTPILRQPAMDRAPSYWGAGAVTVALALGSGVLVGFGKLASPLAIAPVSHVVVYAVLAAVLAYCLLRSASARNARERLPYEPGLYLFPAGVFDARVEPIRVFRHPDVQNVSVVDSRRVRVQVEGNEFVFELPDGQTAEEARTLFERAREQYDAAMKTENRRERALLDPMVDSGFSSPFSPNSPLSRDEPLWARFALVFAVLVGVVVGPAVWKARNLVSERRIYKAAVDQDDVEGYQAYLARGGRRPQVSEILLPRAELRAVAQSHTVGDLESFASAHPGSKIGVEMDAAIHAAVLTELDDAVKQGTLTALRQFRQQRARYPFIVAPIDAAELALYKHSLESFSPGKSLPALSFYERLLGYTKSTGSPRVSLRFVRKIPASVEGMDEQVKRSGYFMGKQSIPSQYFTGKYAEAREQKAGERLQKIVADRFPTDMLDVAIDPTVVAAEAPPLGKVPTLFVEYAPEMAGGYMSQKPRGVFVGVGMMFRASFQIPGDSAPLEYRSSQWRVPNALVMSEPGTGVGDVYEKMAADGFDKFIKGFATYVGSSTEK